jgi:CIC family chloride channel protein
VWDLVVAKELATSQVITAFPDETLRDVLDKIGVRNIEHVPVVSREEPRKILGVVSRRDILGAYRRAFLARFGAGPASGER